jgi:hypothetical protein
MATLLNVGDIAIVQYNSGTTDTFTFVFLIDVEVGTTVNFTDNGWLAAGGFRPGEGTVTYVAPSAITAGTTVTLSGLNLDDAGIHSGLDPSHNETITFSNHAALHAGDWIFV